MQTRLLSFVFAGVTLIAIAAPAQSSDAPSQLIPRTPEQREQMYRAEHRIRLNVTVTDATGEPLTGLTAEDFALIDNGRPRPIAEFADVGGVGRAAMVHATLVIDGISSHDGMGRMRKDLVKFFSADSAPLFFPIELAVLSENGVATSAWLTDRTALAAELTRLTQHVKALGCDAAQPDSDLSGRLSGTFGSSSPNGSPALDRERCNNDKFVDSLNYIQKLLQDSHDAKGRGILIWLGPGWPIPAAPDAGQILPGVTHDDFAQPIAMLLTELREADVTLDAVTWSELRRAKNLRSTTADAAPGPRSIADLALPMLVSDTGGWATEKSKRLDDAIRDCLAEAQRYYILTFDATPSDAPDEFHRIEVKVDKPGATVRTATVYYAQP
ncbi:MAG TPA: VWA domain-containing protein [Terracidiphilus sp.]|nr:VWA domain-containing protein [Terracidiphilus sp.]